MANLKVNARITAPENIDIPLVRADVMRVSATFRTFFEVFLSLTSALIGHMLSLQETIPLHWVSLTVVALATLVFLILSLRKQSEATVES